MTNPTQDNDNNFFKLACLASIIAGTTLAVIALASAAPVGLAISAGVSVAVGGILLSTLVRFCCGCVGAGWGSGPIVVGNPGPSVVVVNSSPSYWSRFSNWWSRPWFSGPSWFSGWGNSWNSNNFSSSRHFHGHQATVPVSSSNVHGHASMRPTSSFSSTAHAPYVQPRSSGGFFNSFGQGHSNSGHHATSSFSSHHGGGSAHHAAPSFGGGHSHGHR